MDSAGQIQCRVQRERLYTHSWGQYSQCKACMDKTVPAQQAEKWRGEKAWAALAATTGSMTNPYASTQIGTCDGMQCAGQTVAFNGACIPCAAPDSDWASVCGAKVFNAMACPAPVDTVCQACSAANAAAGVLTDAVSIERWLGARKDWPDSSKVCKFVCDAGYTSNPDPLAYPTAPCLKCSYASVQCKDASEFLDYSKQDCGQAGIQQYMPYTSVCSPCSPLVVGVQFSGPWQGATSNTQCPGACDPVSYFTFSNGSKVSNVVQQGDIDRCELCSEEHLTGCSSDLCVKGYYRFVFMHVLRLQLRLLDAGTALFAWSVTRTNHRAGLDSTGIAQVFAGSSPLTCVAGPNVPRGP